MKKRLLFALILAAMAAVFASRNPDGLDKVSQTLGFSEKGVEGSAVMGGYSAGFLGEGALSTVFAGLTGVLIVFAVFMAILFVFKRFGSKGTEGQAAEQRS